MAITAANLLTGANAVAAASFVTASISYSANSLVVLTVGSVDTANSAVPTVTGASLTWVQIDTKVSTGANHRRLTMFRGMSGSSGSGALTIDFAGSSQPNCAWSVDQFQGTDLSGTNGSGAVVQFTDKLTIATEAGDSITLTSALKSANNAIFAGLRQLGNAALTSGATLTQLSNQVSVEVVGTEWKINKTVADWTWASVSSDVQMIAIEVKDNAEGKFIGKPEAQLPDWW